VPSIAELKRKPPVPQSKYVSVLDLANELGVTDVERLRPLIEYHYLRILEAHEYLADCLVGRPEPDALRWLKGMLEPLTMRPFLTVEQAAELMQCNVNELRLLCVTHNFQLYADPAFGELISIYQFHRLFDRLRETHDGIRFDRQSMLLMLRNVMPQRQGFRYRQKPLSYSKRLELEIIRIGKLPEPDRTLRAVALWESYCDARNIRDCLQRYYKLTKGEAPEVEERLKNLVERCVGEISVDAETESA